MRETYTNIAHTLQGIGDIVTQRQAADQMGGPILMAQVTAKVAEGGIEPMLRWIAFISANIGFLNLLPIPVLDGGHLVYYAIEGVLRQTAEPAHAGDRIPDRRGARPDAHGVREFERFIAGVAGMDRGRLKW